MHVTRRSFIAWSATGLAGAMTISPRALATALRQQEGLEVKQLRDGVHAVIGGGGNVVVIASEEGGILIDSKLPQSVFMLQERAKALLDGKSPVLLLNTHHHGDHTGGNFVFADVAKIVGHRNIKPRIQETVDSWLRPSMNRMASQLRQQGKTDEADALARQATNLSVGDFAADEEFDNALTLTRGERTLKLTHHADAHTDNDAIIFLPEENVIHMGDLFFHEIHPYMDVGAGSNSTGWREFVQKGIDMCDAQTVVVPGHGAITDVEGLKKQIAYFDHLEDVARKALRNGISREMLSTLSLGPYGDYEGDRGFTNLANVYDELKAG